MSARIDWAAEFTTDMGVDGVFPFVEDEQANITGFGHQSRAVFAAAVNRYDELGNGAPLADEDQWTADDITHRWAKPLQDVNAGDDWRLMSVPKGAPDAIPVTTLWGQR